MKTVAPITIHFESSLYMLGKWMIVGVPESESVKLPSRGQVSVTGKINGHDFQTVLEPDGRWSHWFKLNDQLQEEISAHSGDTVSIEITTNQIWPEPNVPEDFARALSSAPEKIQKIWEDITPMARWEWIRWVNATSVIETRQRRIEASISKMDSGKRRPCCFNLAACTDPELSKSGRLITPSQVERLTV